MARAGKAARVVGEGDTDRIGLLHPLGARRRRGQRLDARGIRVHVATNSLAPNDVPLAFVGYSISRKKLIRTGVIQECARDTPIRVQAPAALQSRFLSILPIVEQLKNKF